jgi:hypothetical protein
MAMMVASQVALVRKPVIEKAVLKMVDWLNNEGNLCQ